MRWKNRSNFKGLRVDELSRRRLIEDRDTILELTGKIQELQNEINCMNDSRDFQDAESVRSGHSHVTSQPVSFPPHPIPGGMLSRSIGMPSRREGPPSIWDTHGKSGNVFAIPVAFSSAPYPKELNCEGGVDVVGVVTPLVRGLRRLCCMVIRLSSSVCYSGCMRKEKWKRTLKVRSK